MGPKNEKKHQQLLPLQRKSKRQRHLKNLQKKMPKNQKLQRNLQKRAKNKILQKKQDTPKKSPQQTRVQKLRGGTVAEILTPGQGQATASKGQKVTVQYEGRLVKNGKKFDSGKFSFKLGK